MLGYFLQKLENFMFMRFHSNKYINVNVVYCCYISRLIKGIFLYFHFSHSSSCKINTQLTFYKNVKEKFSRYFTKLINSEIDCCDQRNDFET